MSSIFVVGSINQDIVVRSDHFPLAGETVLGSDVRLFPGGKGAESSRRRATLFGRYHVDWSRR